MFMITGLMMHHIVPLPINMSFLVITSPEARHRGRGNALNQNVLAHKVKLTSTLA